MYDPCGLRPDVAALLGNSQPGDGARFCGRGYAQITGRRNYGRADAALGLKGALLEDPDLALKPEIAAQILERGMREGWFTGKRLSDVLPFMGAAAERQFIAARRIINGADRAELVADYALRFQDALLLGGWG
jgi:predicted chitinase